METGGIEHAARMHAITLGVDIELQLERHAKAGFQPVLRMLRDARTRAVAAMAQLVTVDATDAAAIRKLQNEIVLFEDMIESCRRMVAEGREADRSITDDERAEIGELIMGDWATAEALGATEVNDR